MAILKAIKGISPQIDESCFLAETAVISGETRIDKDCSIWYNAIIRGDVNSITIGKESNVQDGAILHCTYKKAALNIGARVSIGHNAIVHGCTIQSDVLIGMGAIVMDYAIVSSNVLVAAGALVKEGEILESGYLYAGIPAKKIKPLDERLLNGEINRISKNYQLYSSWYK